MSDNMIKAIGINKYFGKAQVLRDISLSAARGDIYGLIGKNGAGKTTFMRILAGLMKPSSGLTETAGRVSFLPQNVRLRDHRNAAEVIRFYAALRHSDCSMGFALAEELELDMTRKVRNLSPGQQRKLQLVIAAIGRPEIMILDEPTAGLDPMGVRQVRELVRRMNGQGCTFLISSHVLMELDSLCNNAAVIDSGKLLYQGTCNTVYEVETESDATFCTTSDVSHNGCIDEMLSKDLGARCSISGGRLIARIKREEVPELLQILYQHSIRVYGVKQLGLEQLYTGLLKEDA